MSEHKARSAALALRGDSGAPAAPELLEVCERHRSEARSACEGLVYVARGGEAAAASGNEVCKRCGRPLARIADRIRTIHPASACDFCYRTGIPVAVAVGAFMGIPMKICEGCAGDAQVTLAAARASGAPKLARRRKGG